MERGIYNNLGKRSAVGRDGQLIRNGEWTLEANGISIRGSFVVVSLNKKTVQLCISWPADTEY